MSKVSFDFDGTLGSSYKIRRYAKQLVQDGHEVWIVTARWENVKNYNWSVFDHSDLFKVADWCGITKEHIKFCNMLPKADFFYDQLRDGDPFLWHLDDDREEISMINNETITQGISCRKGPNWRILCNQLINKQNDV